MAEFKNMSLHYQRIHGLVAQRLWTDLSDRLKFIITRDAEHLTEEYLWFEKKVALDATRLYEDPNWYGNAEYTFRIPKHENGYYAKA